MVRPTNGMQSNQHQDGQSIAMNGDGMKKIYPKKPWMGKDNLVAGGMGGPGINNTRTWKNHNTNGNVWHNSANNGEALEDQANGSNSSGEKHRPHYNQGRRDGNMVGGMSSGGGVMGHRYMNYNGMYQQSNGYMAAMPPQHYRNNNGGNYLRPGPANFYNGYNMQTRFGGPGGANMAGGYKKRSTDYQSNYYSGGKDRGDAAENNGIRNNGGRVTSTPNSDQAQNVQANACPTEDIASQNISTTPVNGQPVYCEDIYGNNNGANGTVQANNGTHNASPQPQIEGYVTPTAVYQQQSVGQPNNAAATVVATPPIQAAAYMIDTTGVQNIMGKSYFSLYCY